MSHIVTGQAADADELPSQWLNFSGRLAPAEGAHQRRLDPSVRAVSHGCGTIRLAADRQSLFAPCPRRGQPREGRPKSLVPGVGESGVPVRRHCPPHREAEERPPGGRPSCRIATRRDGLCGYSGHGGHLPWGRLNLGRRKPATTAGASTDHARACLAVPPPASATLPCRRPERDPPAEA